MCGKNVALIEAGDSKKSRICISCALLLMKHYDFKLELKREVFDVTQIQKEKETHEVEGEN
jgi:hypothetical protein